MGTGKKSMPTADITSSRMPLFLPSRIDLGFLYLVMLATPNLTWSHGPDAAAAAHPAHIGPGVDMMEPDDSLKIAVDMFGYLANSWTSTLGVGTHLGAGGKGPQFLIDPISKNQTFGRDKKTFPTCPCGSRINWNCGPNTVFFPVCGDRFPSDMMPTRSIPNPKTPSTLRPSKNCF